MIDQRATKELARTGGLVTLKVQDLRLREALSLLVKPHGLTYVLTKGGLLITPADE